MRVKECDDKTNKNLIMNKTLILKKLIVIEIDGIIITN